jgi:septal ring factor EnvC (AmiA/AmiB activator)
MPAFTLAQAIAATGRSRSTLIRAIRQGTITATRDKSGTYLVEPSELHRVFPASDHGMPDDLANGSSRHAEIAARLEAEQAKNAILLDQVQDLRRRLDQADTDRRQALDRLAAAQERITALLTDQRPTASPPRRRWWHWK